MLLQSIQAKIDGVLLFFLNETEYREAEERENEHEARDLDKEDDWSPRCFHMVLDSRHQTRPSTAGSGLVSGACVFSSGKNARAKPFKRPKREGSLEDENDYRSKGEVGWDE